MDLIANILPAPGPLFFKFSLSFKPLLILLKTSFVSLSIDLLFCIFDTFGFIFGGLDTDSSTGLNGSTGFKLSNANLALINYNNSSYLILLVSSV